MVCFALWRALIAVEMYFRGWFGVMFVMIGGADFVLNLPQDEIAY